MSHSPRVKKIDVDLADANTAGVADDLPTGTSWSYAGDAEWLLDATSDGLAHQLVVTTAGLEASGNAPTLTIVGTDADGKAITDSVVLPDTSTVETTKYFKTFTSATTDAATVGTMDIGWVDEAVTHTFPINRHNSEQAHVHLDITGTINVTVEETICHVQDEAQYPEQASYPWFTTDVGALETATADASGMVRVGAVALRLKVNSYSSGAEVQMYISQARGSL